MITWITASWNSRKLWDMPWRATQDGQVMVESSGKTCSTGEGNDKPLWYSCLDKPMNNMKKQKDMTPEDESPRSVGIQYATGEEWRNNSGRNEEAEPKWKCRSVVDVSCGENKLQCHKEQFCIRIWNVRSMNQDKLDIVKQEEWTGNGKNGKNEHIHFRNHWTKMERNGQI